MFLFVLGDRFNLPACCDNPLQECRDAAMIAEDDCDLCDAETCEVLARFVYATQKFEF